MEDLRTIDVPTETDLLVAFSDLTLFSRYARSQTAKTIFETMEGYFELLGEIVEKGGGWVVKCMGDAALIVFPEARAEDGVQALRELKGEGDRWLEARGMSCRHQIKVHFGPVVCGLVGSRKDKRFDVYGQTVNTAALLKANGLALSPQAFRKLGPEARKHFKKHTPPVVYIPVEERHRD
ncbi:MAG: adenylate/guanylate cyclase domain-containing protein [Planctomycetota bacterium]